MAKEKACKICKLIYQGDKCPNCDCQEYSDDVKGKIMILNPEKSEISKKLKVSKKGTYAIKI